MRKFRIHIDKRIEGIISQQISLIVDAETEEIAWEIARARISKFGQNSFTPISINKLEPITDNQAKKEKIYLEVKDRVTLPYEGVRRLIEDDMQPWIEFRKVVTRK